MPLTIPCQQCGAKNPLGKIYCVKCGEALDASGLEHKMRSDESAFNFRRWFNLFRSLVSFVLLILVLGTLVGMFLPVEMGETGTISEQEGRKAKEKYDRLVAESSGRAVVTQDGQTFSQKELTFLANSLGGLLEADKKDPGFSLLPVQLSVEPLNNDALRIVLHSRVVKNLHVYSTLIGQIVEKDGKYRFATTKTKVGKIPFPGKAKSIVEKRFSLLFLDVKSLDDVLNKADTIRVSDGQLVVRIKKKSSR